MINYLPLRFLSLFLHVSSIRIETLKPLSNLRNNILFLSFSLFRFFPPAVAGGARVFATETSNSTVCRQPLRLYVSPGLVKLYCAFFRVGFGLVYNECFTVHLSNIYKVLLLVWNRFFAFERVCCAFFLFWESFKCPRHLALYNKSPLWTIFNYPLWGGWKCMAWVPPAVDNTWDGRYK